MLKTERLLLEELAPRHAPMLLAYYERNRAHLESWEPTRSAAFYTVEFHESAIAASEHDAEHGLSKRFVAFELGGPEIVASINLMNIRRGVVHSGIIGYSVDARYEGRGYATEAAGAVVRYAFDVLNLHRLETSYQPTNERSGRVLRNLGFVVEGYARDYLFLNGAWRDGILVSLTNPKWRASDIATG